MSPSWPLQVSSDPCYDSQPPRKTTCKNRCVGYVACSVLVYWILHPDPSTSSVHYSPLPRRTALEALALSTSAAAPIFFNTSTAFEVLVMLSTASLSTRGTSGTYSSGAE